MKVKDKVWFHLWVPILLARYVGRQPRIPNFERIVLSGAIR